MKKVAVCGGAGFIGTWMSQKLRDEGCYVVSYDRKMPEFGFAPAHEYHVFDLRNSADYYSAWRWQDFDEVYQFAAEMGGAGYVFTGEHDADIMHSSASINLNVLDVCRKAGVKKMFFASSACVYPTLPTFQHTTLWADGTKTFHGDTSLNIACREQDAGCPDSPYGLEKLFSESLYDSYARTYDMDIKIGRFHNIFGEYGTWRGGREKSPAAFCRKIAEVRDEIPGATIECWGDGEQARSFLHASEAVEAVSRLMQSDFRGPVNIGSSEMVTINQMIAMIADISGKTFGVKHVDGPLGVRGRNSDNSLIQEKLGWKPSKTLREGLERTYPWIAEQVLTAKKLSDSVTSR